MAKSQTGKWVSRVASTGGSKSYRAQRPMNFYGLLILIVVVGLVSIFWARSHYQSTNAAISSTTPPTVGSTSYAGMAFDICGTIQPALLPSSTASTAALTAQANGVIKVAPKKAADAGDNATIALFASTYPGLTLNQTTVQIPKNGTSAGQNYTNGQKCAAGTPDAGKQGALMYSYWTNFASTAAQTSTVPTAFHFTANSLVTVSFLPPSTKASKPPSTTISAMLQAAQASTTTTTGASSVTTTTIPSVTTTTAPTTTTTKK